MAEIRLQRALAAPAEHVFDLLADHEHYDRFRGIHASALTREGENERNGIGARRRITARPLSFDEEITAFERPRKLDYLILDVNFPLRHHGGSITLTPAGEATEVLWVSTFDVTVPLVGGPSGSVVAAMIKRGFSRVLEDIERAYRPASSR